MNKKIYLFSGMLIISVGILVGISVYFSSQEKVVGAPQVFISTPATTTRIADFGFTIGTTTSLSLYGSTTLAIYGSTTIQTPVNTTHAFRVINAASSTIFEIDTVNASTTVAGPLNAQTLTVTSCTGCGGLTGGSINALTYWTSATAISATSSPTVGYITATTSSYSLLTGGLISAASSTFSSGAFRVEGAATFPGGVTITCTSCITDANVSNTLTASDLVAASSVVSDAEVDNDLTISGGTINNSAIGATTPLTGAFTTLSATGLFSMYGNLTATSTLTLQAGGLLNLNAANFRIVASSSLTTNDAGAMGIDTTTGQLRFYDGATTQVHVATSSMAANVSSTTLRFYGGFGASATGTILRDGKFQAYTITEISCRSRNATTTGSNTILQAGTGSASTSPIVFCNTNGQQVPITSGGGIGANTVLMIGLGTASSTIPDQVFFDVRYKWDSN